MRDSFDFLLDITFAVVYFLPTETEICKALLQPVCAVHFKFSCVFLFFFFF